MRSFSSVALFLLGAGTALATNTVTFKSLDQINRKIIFTPNAGLPTIAPVEIPAGQDVPVEVPQGWIGNWFSVSEGEAEVPGMLAEVAFNGWGGITFFDVSAIVNPNDRNGVKELFPATDDGTPVSGCKIFPCNNAYYVWDDVQTKATHETDLICTLGNGPLDARNQAEVDAHEPVFKREFVTGEWMI